MTSKAGTGVAWHNDQDEGVPVGTTPASYTLGWLDRAPEREPPDISLGRLLPSDSRAEPQDH
jgi:hypothetical protein